MGNTIAVSDTEPRANMVEPLQRPLAFYVPRWIRTKPYQSWPSEIVITSKAALPHLRDPYRSSPHWRTGCFVRDNLLLVQDNVITETGRRMGVREMDQWALQLGMQQYEDYLDSKGHETLVYVWQGRLLCDYKDNNTV
jgi:hypothetical protein